LKNTGRVFDEARKIRERCPFIMDRKGVLFSKATLDAPLCKKGFIRVFQRVDF